MNPIDAVIWVHKAFDVKEDEKFDEVPYDLNRKRLSILFLKEHTQLIVIKESLKTILDVCSFVETADGKTIDITIGITNVVSYLGDGINHASEQC